MKVDLERVGEFDDESTDQDGFKARHRDDRDGRVFHRSTNGPVMIVVWKKWCGSSRWITWCVGSISGQRSDEHEHEIILFPSREYRDLSPALVPHSSWSLVIDGILSITERHAWILTKLHTK